MGWLSSPGVAGQPLAYPSSWLVATDNEQERSTRTPSDGEQRRRSGSGRLLAVVLVVQLVLAGLLIWAASTGFAFLRSWL